MFDYLMNGLLALAILVGLESLALSLMGRVSRGRRIKKMEFDFKAKQLARRTKHRRIS